MQVFKSCLSMFFQLLIVTFLYTYCTTTQIVIALIVIAALILLLTMSRRRRLRKKMKHLIISIIKPEIYDFMEQAFGRQRLYPDLYKKYFLSHVLNKVLYNHVVHGNRDHIVKEAKHACVDAEIEGNCIVFKFEDDFDLDCIEIEPDSSYVYTLDLNPLGTSLHTISYIIDTLTFEKEASEFMKKFVEG